MQLKSWLLNTPKSALAILFSLLSGFCVAGVILLRILPPGMMSLMSLAIASCIGLITSLLVYFGIAARITQLLKKERVRLIFIALLAIFLAGTYFQTIINDSRQIFLFLPQNELSITNLSGDAYFRPVNCEFITIYSKNYSPQNLLNRIDAELMILQGDHSTVTWKGWTGKDCDITFIKNEKPFQASVDWNGVRSVVDLSATSPQEKTIKIVFEVPLISKLGLFFLVLGAILPIILLIYFLFTSMEVRSRAFEKQPISSNSRGIHILNGILVGLISLLALIQFIGAFAVSNPYAFAPARDSGVFMTIGEGILQGKIPYRDLWDHKGPLIYFINALGLAIPNSGEWGVFGLRILFTILTIYLIFRLIKKYNGTVPAVISVFIYSVFLQGVLGSGNFTEEYALPLFMLGSTFFLQATETKKDWLLLISGMTAGGAFLLRPNLISIFIAAGLVWIGLIIAKRRLSWIGLVWIFLGGISVLILTLVYFASQNALADLYDQMFRYNIFYNQGENLGWLTNITSFHQSAIPIVLIGFVGLVAVLALKQTDRGEVSNRLFAITCSLALGIEILLSGLNSLHFSHYYLPMLLLVTLLFSSTVGLIWNWLNTFSLHNKFSSGIHIILRLILGAGIVFFSVRTVSQFPKEYWQQRWQDAEIATIMPILETRPTLLMWGAEATWNHLTGISSPSRYIYQYPLFNQAYCTNLKGLEFSQDIEASLPVIIDASRLNSWIIPLEPDLRKANFAAQNSLQGDSCLTHFFDFFDTNYIKGKELSNHWVIYLPKSPAK